MTPDPGAAAPSVPPAPASAAEVAGPLAVPGVAALIATRALSALGAQVLEVAVAWQVYALTGSALSLGLVGLAGFLPVAALVFVAGQVVDRHDRRRIALLCLGLEAAGGVLLVLAARARILTAPEIYGFVALIGAARAFEGPSLQSILPGLVAPAMFPRAAALSSSLSQLSAIVGPAVGGLLFGFGAQYAFLAATAGFAAAAIALAAVPRPLRPATRGRVTLASLFGGIGFIRSRPEILGAISLDLFAVLFGGATALMPVYAARILHAGPIGLGALRAGPAVGALAMSLVLARHAPSRRAGRLMFGSVAIFGLGTVAFGLSRSLAFSVACLAVIGAADVVSVVIRSSLVQLRTPDEMRGRVGAVNLLFIGSSNELGEFESGVLASAIGAVPAVVLGGIGTLAVTAIWMGLFPSLRRLDRLVG